ncbi:hypothetical protein A1D31_00020 [Bradyrhizobium liaoningense]|nr:hypothetical protein A1D31_00020 [Bradyrhizobium liaoningense]
MKARGETGSPTVEDLLEQVRDYFTVLNQVEVALAEDGTNAIEWRIVSATTNSPIELVAEGYSREFGVNIDRRVDATVRHAAIGMYMLETSMERPSYFSDETIKRVQRIFERVTNGLEETKIDHGADLPVIDLKPTIARTAVQNAKAVLAPPEKPYTEQGSVEGVFRTIGRDGFGRLVLWLRVRLTGEDIKCVLTGSAEEDMGEHRIREITAKKRLRVYGTLYYKGRGKLDKVDGVKVRFMRARSELPDLNDILDTDFTNGLTSEEYLRQLRDGELS